MVAGVDFGAHLPLIDFGTPASLPGLKAYAHTAAGLGYRYLCANDHLLFGRPWLDGPTALAAVIEESQDMTLATTVSLPVIRGPAQLAKTLAAIDILSDGRLVVGVGPGSSARDYAAAGISFDERWPRFGEAIPMLRALLAGDQAFEGAFYSSHGIDLEPRPAQRPTPPIWVATGAHRPAYGGSRGPATAGSRPPTTPLPSGSAKGSHAWRRRWSRRGGRSLSQTLSGRRGSTSPKTFAARSASSLMSLPRCSTGRWRSCVRFRCRSVPPKCAPSESQRSPTRACSGCLSGPCATGQHSSNSFANAWCRCFAERRVRLRHTARRLGAAHAHLRSTWENAASTTPT